MGELLTAVNTNIPNRTQVRQDAYGQDAAHIEKIRGERISSYERPRSDRKLDHHGKEFKEKLTDANEKLKDESGIMEEEDGLTISKKAVSGMNIFLAALMTPTGENVIPDMESAAAEEAINIAPVNTEIQTAVPIDMEVSDGPIEILNGNSENEKVKFSDFLQPIETDELTAPPVNNNKEPTQTAAPQTIQSETHEPVIPGMTADIAEEAIPEEIKGKADFTRNVTEAVANIDEKPMQGLEAPVTAVNQNSEGTGQDNPEGQLETGKQETQAEPVKTTGDKTEFKTEDTEVVNEAPKTKAPAQILNSNDQPVISQTQMTAQTSAVDAVTEQNEIKQIDTQNIINQIVEGAALTKTAGSTELQINLRPEFLGKVSLLISSTDQGIKCSIKVADESVRQAMTASINELQTSFKDSGINMTEISVTDSNIDWDFSRGGGENANPYNRQDSQNARRNAAIGRFMRSAAQDETDQQLQPLMYGYGNSYNSAYAEYGQYGTVVFRA